MLKRTVKLGLLMTSIALLFSCGTSAKNKAGLDGSGDITTILVDEGSGIDDRSFNQSAWKGITSYYGDTPENPTKKNVLYKEIYAATPDIRLPNVRLASDEAPDLIVATGFTFASVIKEVAMEYKNQSYLMIDDNSFSLPNVRSVVFAEQEASYLVGMAIALKAKEEGVTEPKFGFIGGIPGPVLTRFEVGYVQGILSVLPNAQFFDYYANDWAKPELGKVQAKAWYDAGVYAIFTAAGSTGNGAISQAKEYRDMGKNVWVIGVDSDQYEDGLYGDLSQSAVFTSAIKRVDITTLDTLNRIKDGSFKGETVIYSLKDGGVDYSTRNSSLNSNIIKLVNAAKEDIKSGKVKVFATYESAVKSGNFPNTLKAVD